jgi:hypothetical protein
VSSFSKEEKKKKHGKDVGVMCEQSANPGNNEGV